MDWRIWVIFFRSEVDENCGLLCNYPEECSSLIEDSSGMWRCVVRCLVADVSKEYTAYIFRNLKSDRAVHDSLKLTMKVLRSFETRGTAHPKLRRNVSDKSECSATPLWVPPVSLQTDLCLSDCDSVYAASELPKFRREVLPLFSG
jgi:hypothetical protein